MAASHVPVPEGWIDKMAAEGRNPFCALCHDSRGPLSEGARDRALQKKQSDWLKNDVSDADREAVMRYIQSQ
ncbi:hypothetical protein D3C84_1260570 [compost metagenome]